MDNTWVGRKLMAASGELVERFLQTTEGGPAVAVVAPIARSLLNEIGLSLVLGEKEPRLPFSRTRGMLRLPSGIDELDLTRPYKALAVVVAAYLRALPGASSDMEQFACDAVRYASRVTVHLHRELLKGNCLAGTYGQFGGLALLVYEPGARAGVQAQAANQ